ncbi:MAG: nicotinate-nucleotide adenylyltransferase [Psychrobacter glaciei]
MTAISVSNDKIEVSTKRLEKVLLGGTFDPIHNGHLTSAQDLIKVMGYDSISLMPCGQAYHKEGSSQSQHRLNMVKLAVEPFPGLLVDDREVKRQGATYTVDTLQKIRQELGSNAHIVWVMGTDSAKSLEQWHQWQHIFTLANVIVISRAAEPELNLPHWPAKQVNNVNKFKQHASGCYMQLGLTPVDLSSSEVREAINNHKPVDNHVPQAVIEYIEQHGLYRGLN